VQLVVFLDQAADRPAADLLNYANTVIGIYDLVANVEIVVH
jgi:hypothetical protein